MLRKVPGLLNCTGLLDTAEELFFSRCGRCLDHRQNAVGAKGFVGHLFFTFGHARIMQLKGFQTSCFISSVIGQRQEVTSLGSTARVRRPQNSPLHFPYPLRPPCGGLELGTGGISL